MAKTDLTEKLQQGLFFLDGAMGTQLIATGIKTGACNDLLNIESPQTVIDIHKAYLQAGSDAIITNTFSANPFTLAKHGQDEKAEQINLTGAQNARKAVEETDPDKYVLGGLGPCGEFLPPVGKADPQKVSDTFVTQAKALLEGGVDGFIVETMMALNEMTVAVQAVQSVSDLPILASFAFNPAKDGFRTLMGVSPDMAVSKMVSLGVDAVGFNCGSLSIPEYITLSQVYANTLNDSDVLLLAEPNAGKPELTDTGAVYDLAPGDFAQALQKINTAGVTILGGCCGTGPDHIKAMTSALKP
jgi:5-methyltetrahydrofolate--homocysteine methyltransferase